MDLTKLVPKENLVGTFWNYYFDGNFFFSSKGGSWPPFLGAQPPFWGKKFPQNLKEFPPNSLVLKIPTEILTDQYHTSTLFWKYDQSRIPIRDIICEYRGTLIPQPKKSGNLLGSYTSLGRTQICMYNLFMVFYLYDRITEPEKVGIKLEWHSVVL